MAESREGIPHQRHFLHQHYLTTRAATFSPLFRPGTACLTVAPILGGAGPLLIPHPAVVVLLPVRFSLPLQPSLDPSPQLLEAIFCMPPHRVLHFKMPHPWPSPFA